MLALALLAIVAAPATIYQTAPYDVLATGRFDGTYQVSELSKHGDFGMGTFNGLDGEMVVLDGKVFQNDGYGDAHQPNNPLTPFAFVTHFKAEWTFTAESMSKGQVQQMIDELFPDQILAIRIEGTFARTLGRSFARQIKPYKPLGQIMDRMSLFPYDRLEGTFVGFRMPKSVSKGNLNVAGYHFHFLTSDRRHGGHVLSYNLEHARVSGMRVASIDLLGR